MRITMPVSGDRTCNIAAAEKAGLKGDAVARFGDVGFHAIEYDVNPETGASVPVKIDGLSILREPIKGVVPDHIRERLQGTPPDLRPGESM